MRGRIGQQSLLGKADGERVIGDDRIRVRRAGIRMLTVPR
jgi:hypothetical protein